MSTLGADAAPKQRRSEEKISAVYDEEDTTKHSPPRRKALRFFYQHNRPFQCRRISIMDVNEQYLMNQLQGSVHTRTRYPGHLFSRTRGAGGGKGVACRALGALCKNGCVGRGR